MESKYSAPKFSPIKSLNPISGAIRPSYTAVCLQSPRIQKFTLLNARYLTLYIYSSKHEDCSNLSNIEWVINFSSQKIDSLRG